MKSLVRVLAEHDAPPTLSEEHKVLWQYGSTLRLAGHATDCLPCANEATLESFSVGHAEGVD